MKKTYTTLLLAIVMMTAWAQDTKFTTAEQQQINIPTPGLFERSDAFQIDLTQYGEDEYSFPLPVGKPHCVKNNSGLEITTKKGDAVKAMFEGDVRLSYKHPQHGNTIVIRHNNGLETVYSDNAQNLVHVGDHVKAGQTIAIVGGIGQDCYLSFSVMVDGRKFNPELLIEHNSHNLRPVTIKVKKIGGNVKVSISRRGGASGAKELMAYPGVNALASGPLVMKLADIPEGRWSYPLPGAKVISPYGNRRKGHTHTGVDLKTKPNDEILAAFDGEVIKSGRNGAYGNCVEIKHANGFRTLYSHLAKNLVQVGDVVKAGQPIGLEGRTGRATTEHLHFELFCGGTRYDPARIFDHNSHSLKNITIKVTSSGFTVVK